MGTPSSTRVNQRLAPRRLILVERAGKEAVEQQIIRAWILVEGLFDFAQEAAANDASAAPHQRDAAHIQVPAILFGRGSAAAYSPARRR